MRGRPRLASCGRLSNTRCGIRILRLPLRFALDPLRERGPAWVSEAVARTLSMLSCAYPISTGEE